MQVEKHTIDYIPEEERFGKASDLFPVWFGANMNMTTLVTGAVIVSLGLNLLWSVLAIILGICIGAIFMASHSVQGPRLGIPQMIQSRAQFGVFGAIIPMIFVMFVYLGFSVSNTLLAAQTLSSVVSINQTLIIVVFSVACFAIALYGYQLIHKTQKWLSWISVIVFAVATFLALQLSVPADQLVIGDVKLSSFLLGVSIAATFVLSFAPYVADYSRYLPTNISSSKVFWYTYSGAVISTIWLMILGAILMVAVPNYLDNSGGNLTQLFGEYSPIMYILIVYGLLAINIFNFYGAFMSTITTVEPFYKLKVTPKTRMFFLLGITLLSITLSTWGQGDFVTFFLNFIFFMNYFLIPWTAINLVDYYLIRGGDYYIEDIFDANGRYGKFNGITIIAFLATIALEIPFINTTFYVGPVAQALDGIDLAWLVGLISASLLYYFPMRTKVRKYERLIQETQDAMN